MTGIVKNPIYSKFLQFSVVLVVFVLASLACSLAEPATPAPNLTEVARQVRETTVAEMQATEKAQPPTMPPPPPTQPPPPTKPPATATPYPTYTPYPTPTEAAKPTNPPQPTAVPTKSFSDFAKTARILAYEDNYNPKHPAGGWWIKDALSQAGYSFTHVGDAIGNFQTELNSTTNWDLIIVGEEFRVLVDGPIVTELIRRMNNKTPVIMETWKIYDYYGGGMAPIMTRCGVQFQKKWSSPESLSLIATSHPILNVPHKIPMLSVYTDVGYTKNNGDSLKPAAGSNAILLAGLYPDRPKEYGSVFLCQDEMMILQSFMHHNYQKDAIIKLWQNYIYFMLQKRMSLLP